MLFTSTQFLVFFALVCALAQWLRGRSWQLLLLISSLVFIAAFNPASLMVMLVLSSFTFISARRMVTKSNDLLFYTALIVNILAIILFNYLLSVKGAVVFSLREIDFNAGNLLLIAGLSFYSLQHIAYLVDVQKKRMPAETDYSTFLLASCYFPKYISGPLTLYQQLKPQLEHNKPADKTQLWQGFNRMIWGFLKKMVIADRLAPSVSSVFDYQDALPGLTIFTGAVLFTIQLYFDFSGYTDIAIGASEMLGIQLPENFNFPLRATSVTVFWRRWHRSLIHFFTTYIFYPVSFKFRRLKKHAAALAIAITFLVSGLWHGIGFTFMAWALCHMLCLLAELYFVKRVGKTQDSIQLFKKGMFAAVVLILVSFSNIFFRATTTANCLHLLGGLFTGPFFPASWPVDFVAPIAVGGHQAEHFNLAFTTLFTLLALIFERKFFVFATSQTFRPLVTFIVLLIIFLFGVFNSGQRFIYMQF